MPSSPFLSFHYAGGKLGRRDSAEQREGKGGGGRRTQNLLLALDFLLGGTMCQFFRAGGRGGGTHTHFPRAIGDLRTP